jgi:hypothetical protein
MIRLGIDWAHNPSRFLVLDKVHFNSPTAKPRSIEFETLRPLHGGKTKHRNEKVARLRFTRWLAIGPLAFLLSRQRIGARNQPYRRRRPRN